jgi:hypothetical protein
MASGPRPPSPPASALCARRARPPLALLCLALACGCDSCDNYDDACDPTASTSSVGGIWTISGQGERVGCADPRNNGSFELGPSSKLAVEMVSEAVDSGPREAAVLEASSGDLAAEAGAHDAAVKDAQKGVDATIKDSAVKEAAVKDAAPKSADATVKDGPREAKTVDAAITDGPREARAGDARRDGVRDARRDLRHDTRWPTTSYRYVLRLRSAPVGFSLAGQVQGSCVTFTTSESDLLGTILYQFKGKASSGRVIRGRFTGTGPTGCVAGGTFTVEYR